MTGKRYFTDAQVLTFENDLTTTSEPCPIQMARSSRITVPVKDTAKLLPIDIAKCGMGGVKNGQKEGDEEEHDCETVHVGSCKANSVEMRELG